MSVALELAEIRRSVDVGFATIHGQLALMLQRADRSDRELAALKAELVEARAEHKAELEQVRAEFQAALADQRRETEDLKRGRWPLPALASLVGLAGLVLAAIPLISH
nr:hypothetical protein [Streptomyces sp. TLI_235]